MSIVHFDRRAMERKAASVANNAVTDMRAKLTGAPRNALTIRDEHETAVRELELDAFRAFNRRMGVVR